MMIKDQGSLILSPYMELYDLIVPKDNLLRKIKELVDFRFVMKELRDKYSLTQGRNATPPIRMFKYLLLKSIFDLSDVDVVERSRYDMSFKYFLDMAPEEEVINPSSLTKFRKLRLKDMELLNLLIGKTVEIAIDKGIIKSKTIIVDATHSRSRYSQKSPTDFLKEKSKLLRKSVYQVNEEMKELFPKKPTRNDVVEELDYCREVIKAVEKKEEVAKYPSVKERLNYLKEVVEDYQDELSYSNDLDAKVGYKSKDDSFFGYKTHIAVSEERIITAAVVTTGESSDGKHLESLVEESQKNGLEIDTVVGDAAYSSKANIIYTGDKKIKLVSKLNTMVSRPGSKEHWFEFNKDAGMFVCKAGHLAISKKSCRDVKKGNSHHKYFFDVQKCKVCPLRDGCYKGTKKKSYTVTTLSDEHQAQKEFQESDYFKEKAKERYKIEAKNSELKNRHGYGVASSSGLINMELQGAVTMFAVNLKRIVKLMD